MVYSGMAIVKRKYIRIFFISFGVLFMTWQFSTYQARDVPDADYTSTGLITYSESDDLISFKVNGNQLQEFIFFPGGGVDPDAYVPLARDLAEEGFNVHIVKMPFRMPIWGYEKILELFDWKNGHYILGGHSQGAKMAAQFTYEHPDLPEALFLIATSHPRDIDMSGISLRTIKIHGDQDGLSGTGEVVENISKMPLGSTLHTIKGGNHSQFGYMGYLLMDGSATISREEQQRQTVEILVEAFSGE